MDHGDVGRVLLASLHQSIADELPARLEFYESWLRPEALRQGAIGMSAFAAVLSFLRQEGPSYERVATRAGEYAAEWSFDGLSESRRGLLRRLPRAWRARIALGLARRLVQRTFRSSFALSRLRRGTGTFDIERSVFCNVREPVSRPLCIYYAAALARLIRLCGVDGTATSVACRGTGDETCRVAVALDGHIIEE